MRAISVIFRRELAAYLQSPVGYIVVALLLFIDGVLFQSLALGRGERLSADVLRDFFELTGIVTIIAGVALSVRLIAEERQQHTIVLLNTSPVRDVEIVIGKFLSAFVFLAGMVLLSVYMPLLIMVNGKIAPGELVAGYLGLLLLGGASLSIGIFASAMTRHQLAAVAVAGAISGFLVLLFHLARTVDEPLRGVLERLDMWWLNFRGGFMVGVINLADVVYYLAVIYFFLLLATKTMEAKRWR
jgi:ABC-2 type transport system permease protein